MFIEDIKNDFYNVILGNRVLLLVHYDVDAVCSCKILQELFKCDNISYTLVPVGGVSELRIAYEDNKEEIKFVVLINCGGTIDIVDILQPDEDVVFFVLDSHKPTDVCNVYSDGQVRLVYKDSDENIPNFEDIFRDDDEEEEDEAPSGGRAGLEAAVERRRERRAWEENRHTLMFNYTQFSYYGKPSALVLLELCCVLSRAGPWCEWSAAVAAAAARELSARDQPASLLDQHTLLTRLAATHDLQSTRVSVVKDLLVPLYREWSLESAVRHSPHLAPALRLHALRGDAHVRQLLADMGIPLQQARQSFRAMDVELRRGLLPALEAAAARRQLGVVATETYLLHAPLTPPVSALDMVYVIMALIENDELPAAEGFQLALQSLSTECGVNGARARGVATAKRALAAAAAAVARALSARALRLAGPFTYFVLQEGSAESALVRGPQWLPLVCRWVSRAAGPRPLLAAADRCGRSLLVGLPPHYHSDTRNLFGAAFEQAASKSGVQVSLDHFDSCVVSVPVDQRAHFLDALTALLS